MYCNNFKIFLEINITEIILSTIRHLYMLHKHSINSQSGAQYTTS